MKPEIIKQIVNSQGGQELVAYLKAKIKELDSIRGITSTGSEEIAVEVKARERAQEKLLEILEMLLSTEVVHKGIDPDEYVV